MRYLHRCNIVHRDIKPENILLDSDNEAKICDFGLSTVVGQSGLTGSPCGSPAYAAPEVLEGNEYAAKCSDCWSLGVLLYVMVTGHLPWSGADASAIYLEAQESKYVMPDSVSPQCSDLIRGLMTVNVSERLPVEEALGHPWLRRRPLVRSRSTGSLNMTIPKQKRIIMHEMVRQVQPPLE